MATFIGSAVGNVVVLLLLAAFGADAPATITLVVGLGVTGMSVPPVATVCGDVTLVLKARVTAPGPRRSGTERQVA